MPEPIILTKDDCRRNIVAARLLAHRELDEIIDGFTAGEDEEPVLYLYDTREAIRSMLWLLGGSATATEED